MTNIRKDDRLMAMLSIWGIILVVIGHSGFTSPEIADRLSIFHQWIYTFHMPLFFFISGYLYSLTNRSFQQIDNGRFIAKKFNRLLIPYFVLGVVIFIIKYVFANLSTADRTFSIDSFLYMFVAPQAPNSTMGFLWYLITLFVIFLIVRTISLMGLSLKSNINCLFIIALSWIAELFLPRTTFLNISGVLWYLPFFICGILFQINIQHKIISGGGKSLIFSLLLFLAIYVLNLKYWSPIPFFGRIIMALVGIYASILLCEFLLTSKFATKYILPFSKDTYSIYLLSWFGQYPLQILCVNIFHLEWFISFVLIFIGGITFPLLVRRCIERISKLRNIKLLTLTIGY